jgi:signal transduction histidine kinase
MGYLEPVKINPLSISLNRIVMKCVAELSPELEASGVDVRVSQGDGLSDLYGDPELLVRILTRLIRNTAGQAAKGGMIHLKTFESGDHLHLALSAPIPLIQQRDPTWFFVPLDEESSRMGLPLSFRLLKRMGGLLSVVQYGEEMAFTLSFPKEKGRPGSEPNAKGAV